MNPKLLSMSSEKSFWTVFPEQENRQLWVAQATSRSAPSKNRTSPWVLCIAILCCFFFSLSQSSLHAQATFGTITGVITDQEGAVLPDIPVTVVNQGTNFATVIKSNRDGNYTATNLHPGSYKVMASYSGFKTFINKDIVLAAQQTLQVNIKLQMGSVESEVVVTGSPVIESEIPTISSTVTSQLIHDNAANALSTVSATGDSGIFAFLYLVPTGYQSSGARFSLGGSRGSEANFNVDGISSNSPAWGNFLGNVEPSLETVQEVRYEYANTRAEFGQVASVTTITKSGTNQLHGSLYEQHQDNALAARDYFSTKSSRFIVNDFGGSLGGPIKHSKLFYFFAYEGQRKRVPATIVDNFPTAKMHSGDFTDLLTMSSPITLKNPLSSNIFSSTNVIQSPYLNSAALKWQQMFYLQPNSGTADNYSQNYRGTYPQAITQNQYDARVDWAITPTNTLYGRYSFKRSTPSVLDSGFPPDISGYRVQQRDANQFALSDTWTLSPKLVNEFKAGFSRNANSFHGTLQGQKIINDLGIQGLPTVSESIYGIPSMSISNFSSPYQISTNAQAENSFQYSDQVTYVLGNHTLKTGTEYRPMQFNNPVFPSFGSYSFDGRFTGFSYADFLLGLPGSTTLNYSRPGEYTRFWYTSAFAQDDWKATRKLTLSYGLRYDYNSPARDKYDTAASFDPATGAIVVPSMAIAQKYVNPYFPSNIPMETAQQAGMPMHSFRHAFKLGFQPRLGFAYQPFESGRTVLRGGYAIFNDTLTADNFQVMYGAPFGLTRSFSNTVTGGTPALTFTNPFVGQSDVGSVSKAAYDKNLRNPYVQQWNLTVEQEVGFKTGLRLSYIGSKASKLIYGRDINQVPASLTPFDASRRPYSNYYSLYMYKNGSDQSYNAITTELKRNWNRGLMFEAAWTWSKNLTNADDVGDVELNNLIENSYDLQRERGDSRYNPRHRFVSTFVWQLPFGSGQRWINQRNWTDRFLGGWSVSGNVIAQTGQFLTPYGWFATDPTNTNSYWIRPNQIANPNLPAGKRSVHQWFNTAAFAAPNPGQFGTARNGSIIGPGQQIVNAALFKSFQITDKSTLRFEGSFTNVLNHPNFGSPDTTVTDTQTVGQVTSTDSGGSFGGFGGSRQGQVSLRYEF